MKLNVRRLTTLLILCSLIQGAYGIQASFSGGDGGGTASVTERIDAPTNTGVYTSAELIGSTILPATRAIGPTALFEETHGVTDASGKSAKVYTKVVNAPSGLSYSSVVLPQEGNVGTQSWVSAEQWLTVPKADSIKATATATYGSIRSSDVGLEEYKSSTLGDYVTLNGYYGKAYTSGTDVSASQTATGGTASSIKVYGHSKDSSGSLGVTTSVSGAGSNFQNLNDLSSAGSSVQVSEKERVHGTFTSTATAGSASRTRTSNYGTDFDLNMLARRSGTSFSATGALGYYVNINNAKANRVQGAVDAASSGDSINVASGKYVENVKIDKSLTIKGAGAGSSIIDGSRAASTLAIGKSNSNIDVALSGLTIQNGDAVKSGGYGGGIYNAGRTTIADSTISGNYAGTGTITEGVGGGIFNKGTMTLTRATVSGNKAGSSSKHGYGAGVFNDHTGVMTVTDSTFSGNAASWDGGAIFNDMSGKLTVQGSTLFTGNTAAFGGGLCNYGTATLTDGTFSSNTATVDGGGIYSIRPGTTIMKGTVVKGNIAKNDGGGIFSYGSPVTMTGITVTGNTAYNAGGGLYNIYAFEDGSNGIMNLQSSTVSGNKAGYKGGGIYNSGTSYGKFTISGSTISGNVAGTSTVKGFGGGIFNNAILTITGSKITQNTATYMRGGIYAGSGGKLNSPFDWSQVYSNSPNP